MKNILKYFVSLATVSMVFVSCSEEPIPSKDTYGDYKGVTGEFAYIVGGTMPQFSASSMEIQHTPAGELGTIEKTFEVALTKAQKSDVVITVGVDNESLTGTYTAFPEDFLNFTREVTIPAGELKATVEVTADNADFARLTELSYMAVFRIETVSSPLEVSTNSNKALLYVTTVSIDPATNKISLDAAEHSFALRNYADATQGPSISAMLDVSGSDAAFSEFEVVMTVDNSLIGEYNEKHGTSYVAVPDGLVDLENATMAKDGKSASGIVSIADDDRKLLTDENGYLVPVRIESAAPATLSETSGVVYLIITVVNFDTPSNMFSALYLGDYNMATWYKFPDGMDLSKGYTIIFHVFLDEITDHARIGNFSDSNEGWINMLRYGQKGNKDTRLEWWVGPNQSNVRKQLYAGAIDAQKWYQYALVYDRNSYKMYLEGKLQQEVTLTDSEKKVLAGNPPVFQAIEFNSSWGANYRSGNELHGRLWNVSVWPRALGAAEISSCYRTAPASSMLRRHGGSHWMFGDGAGYIVRQSESGYRMGDIDFSNTTRVEVENGPYLPADVSEFVQWKTDEFNIFED